MCLHNLIETASFIPRTVQSPNAWVGHLHFAAWIIREISPKTFVELGSHNGNSYFSFCQSVMKGGTSTKCYGIDSWKGDVHAGLYGEEIFTEVNEYNQKNYAEFSTLMRMFFDDAVDKFEDESIDLLHIDGLHTYEAVLHDFETWLPKLSPGAVVMFHDTNVREKNFGVYKLWEELQSQYPNNIEFKHSHGLGVLQLETAEYDKQLDWLQSDSPSQKLLLNYFSSLGARQVELLELEELKIHTATLGQTLVDREVEIDRLTQLLVGYEEKIINLEENISQRTEQTDVINQIYSSKSWRITYPLRAIKSLLRKGVGMLSPENKSLTEFNAKWYLKNNEDVALSGVDPYEHYVQYGRKEGRQPVPDSFLSRNVKRIKVVLVVLLAISRGEGKGFKSTCQKIVRVLVNENWTEVRNRVLTIYAQASLDQKLSHGQNDYAEWINRYDTITNEHRAHANECVKEMQRHPLISVVMPTYNPNSDWLIEAIESVRKQAYPHWELCIADDASTDKKIRIILERYIKDDKRIKVVFRKQNGHISAASNSALELVTGEWVALLDHDDVLSEHALFWVADSINNNPNARLLYSDEDKIDVNGKRSEPYFKCDWNIDLFYSQNMFSHLGVYYTTLLRDIGGFRVGFEGAQDYDLALRCIEQVAADQICHIPRVLYHWRIHATSTAQSIETKPYAMLAGERALNEHFQKRKIQANVKFIGHGYHVNYTLPDTPPLVSLIIPTRNGLELLQQCVESILEKTTYPNYEILIIDNGSDDPLLLEYFENVQVDERIIVVRDDRLFNYSALNNVAVKLANGEVVGLLNNDLQVISSEWLSEMVSIALQPGVGAVGAKLWYPDDTLQHGGVIVGLGGVAGHIHSKLHKHEHGYFCRASLMQSFSVVTAACLVVKKNVYEEVGGLNEFDLEVAFNDVDFCLRLREAGYRNIWTPKAELYHHESATRGVDDTSEKKLRFSKEMQYMLDFWGESLLADPAYSPNLTLDYSNCSFAWPPRIKQF